jgi:uncharacterized protein (TIGR02001 family)
MKKIYLLIAAIVSGVALTAAEAPTSSFSVTTDFHYTSSYVFRGQEYAKDSFQPSIEVNYTDFKFGVWLNEPLKKNVDNEIDFYGGYKYTLNDQWNIDTGLAVYYYPETTATPGFDRETYEGYVGLNGDIKGFTLGLYAYYDFTLKNTALQTQLGYSVPLQNTGISLDFVTKVGRVFPDIGNCYSYWSFEVNLPYQINEKATVYCGVSYNNHDMKGLKRDTVAFTAGVTVAF